MCMSIFIAFLVLLALCAVVMAYACCVAAGRADDLSEHDWRAYQKAHKNSKNG